MRDSQYVFTPPKGFVPPEGTSAGKSFDLVCSFEVMENGQLCMTKLGDTPMSKGEESKPDYSEYSGGLMAGLNNQEAGPPV